VHSSWLSNNRRGEKNFVQWLWSTKGAGKNSARRRSVLLNALDAVDPPRRNRKSHREPKLLVTSTTASSSSAGHIEDIVRLIPAHDRAAFGEMLQHELRGRELPVDETRRIAEQVWKRFLKEGWP